MTHTLENEVTQIERDQVENWVHRWGNSASEAILEPGCLIFNVSHIEGLIGYRLVSGYAVIFGDPVCAIHDKPVLAEAFHTYCNEKNWNIIYLIASENFAKWAIQNFCKVLIEAGEELIFNPQEDATKGSKASKLRNSIHHAQHLGFKVCEYITQDANLEQAMQQVGKEWLRARKGPQIHLGDLTFFGDREQKRWFYVKDGDRLLAMALLSRLKAYQGWLLKYFLTTPDSPRGTSELLMKSILDTLREENCRYVSLGMIPAENLGEIIGLNGFYTWFARFAFQLTKKIFRLNNRKNYWQKFNPKSERSYILFSNPHVGLKELKAVMKALHTSL